MAKTKYTEQEIELLNSKKGLYYLLKDKKVDAKLALMNTRFEEELKIKQEELIQLQNWVIKENKKVVVVVEGRDAAGKGGAIRRITQHINPRHFRIVALNIPTEDERQQWFFQRYINQLPNPGEMVFFDRSWYNRAIVEPVNGFCTKQEHETFMNQVNDFERMLIESDTYLVKIYFSISKKEQAARFKEIKSDPLKHWKLTPVDEKAQELWSEYTKYKNKMFKHTNTKMAPWAIIDANEKTSARLESIDYLLGAIPYKKKTK